MIALLPLLIALSPGAALATGRAMASEPLATWLLTDSDGGFSSYGETGQWEYGEISTGPLSGYTGANGWATGLDRPYYNDSTDYLQLPSVDLSGTTRPVLSFFHWYELDNDGDAAWVEVSDGATWERAEPVYGYSDIAGYSGSSNGWHEAFFDLSDLSDASMVRLVFSSDARIALAGWYVDDLVIVDGDPVPPKVGAVTEPEDTQDLEGPYVVEVTVEDDLGDVSATLWWGETEEELSPLAMTEVSEGLFRGEIPAAPADTDLSWQVEASDGENTAVWPEDGLGEFRVYLAAPTGLTGPEGRVVGTETLLEWTAPESPHTVQGYRVYRDGVLVADSVDTNQLAPLQGPVDTFEVSAVYDVGEGDRSAPLPMHTSIPEISLVSPNKAWQGDRVRVNVVGDYLLFSEGDAGLELGEGVEVTEVEVIDSNFAIFTLEIAEDAPEGPRDGDVVSGDMSLPLPDPFTVLAYDDRPALVSITPEQAEQGDQLDIELHANFELFTTPLVDLGEGVIVESVEADGDTVTVHASVTWTAPVGSRGVTVDDGARVLDGVQFRVRNASTEPVGRCSTAPGPRGLLPLALAALALILRARSALSPRDAARPRR